MAEGGIGMAVIVQKFGGTSVNTPEKRAKVMDKIIAARDKGYDIVVVVSAMGRSGEPYATDTLLSLLNVVSPAPSARNVDLLASCGEIITTCIVAQALEERGCSAVAMTGFQAGILTSADFSTAEIKEIDTEKIKKAHLEGHIVVVAGYQGWTDDKDVTTLGRGGSDTTAIALGGALAAEITEIYTDVPGIAFTDPRLIPNAPYLKSIDYEPMYLLARAGAKVIHPRAVKTAITYQSPFVVRSTFTEEEGTLIGKQGESFGGLYGMALIKGVSILKIASEAAAGHWRKMAVDELFCQSADGEYFLAVQQEPKLSEIKNAAYEVSPLCDLLTIVWDKEAGINAYKILDLLLSAGIKPQGHFPLSLGVTWAVSAEQRKPAMETIFAAFVGGVLNEKHKSDLYQLR